MAKVSKESKSLKAKPVNIKLEEYRDQFVALIPTESDPYHPQGVVYKAHPDVAAKFVANGFADYAGEEYEEGDDVNDIEDIDEYEEEEEQQ